MIVGVSVLVGVKVFVGVAVRVGVRVGVGVEVAVSVSVGVAVGEGVWVAVYEGVGLGVRVGVAVNVGVQLGVGVNSTHVPWTQSALGTGSQPSPQLPCGSDIPQKENTALFSSVKTQRQHTVSPAARAPKICTVTKIIHSQRSGAVLVICHQNDRVSCSVCSTGVDRSLTCRNPSVTQPHLAAQGPKMKIASVKGFHDVLPGETARWAWVEQRARDLFARYHFREVRIPIVEKTELFTRSIGDTTDIVEKEMYTFIDRDGTSLTLRPEGTAGVVRAYVEHALAQREPVSKLFYFGPMFRRERPQKGRLRQFHQVGVEVLGRDDPAIDAEVLMLLHDLLVELDVRRFSIEVNSLGDEQCRPAYREALRAFAEAQRTYLCANCQRRLERNPLRLLDCKVPSCAAIVAEAPTIEGFWCQACRDHFAQVRRMLDYAGVPYQVAPRIVRGLDYYVRTAFEVKAEGLGAQNAVGGGGRYDGLVRSLGGPDVAGIGFALGLERVLLALGTTVDERLEPPLEVFIAPLDREAELRVLAVAQRWRREGFKIELGSAHRSLKSQMRQADKCGAPFVFLVGEAELEAGAASVRDMLRKRDYGCAVSFEWTVSQVRAYLRSLAELAA